MSINHQQQSQQLCIGLVLLLEAAEYERRMSMNTITPPVSTNKKRNIASPSPPPAPKKLKKTINSKQPVVSYDSQSPMKRTKLNFATAADGSHRHPLSTIYIEKTPTRCVGGSSHRELEETHADADGDRIMSSASATRRVNDEAQRQEVSAAVSTRSTRDDINKKSFILYDKDDDQRINAAHNLIRRDIWEGFVVDTAIKEADTKEEILNSSSKARYSVGRLARYDGTVGFRCRFCKQVPLDQRAYRSAVYHRSIECIYSANLRFQRDHIM